MKSKEHEIQFQKFNLPYPLNFQVLKQVINKFDHFFVGLWVILLKSYAKEPQSWLWSTCLVYNTVQYISRKKNV